MTGAIHALHSARNPGPGDLADLGAAAEALAPLGTEFLGINPIHALGAAYPGASPYSPGHRGFYDIRAIAPDLVPEFAGSEEAREAWRRPVPRDGFIDHEEVPAHYAAADVVCYPSLYEPLGNVVLEAMAAGRPIVATDAGGMGEVYEPGTGALVPPGDVAAIREALSLLVDDEGARRAAGAKGLSTAPRFGWDRVARTTAEVCQRVLDDRA